MTYGEAGSRYPVAFGDVWTCGGHSVMCADLETAGADEYLQARQATVMYLDPPWNAGNATTFRRKAGYTHRADYDRLVATLLRLSAPVPVVLIEIGLQQVQRFVDALRVRGKSVAVFPMKYYRKYPCRLLVVTRTPIHGLSLPDADEPVILDAALRVFTSPGDTVVDPVIGRGMLAEVGIPHGLSVHGVDLHPNRLSVTLTKMQRLTGNEPEKYDKNVAETAVRRSADRDVS
jgi:hypothetical protein